MLLGNPPMHDKRLLLELVERYLVGPDSHGPLEPIFIDGTLEALRCPSEGLLYPVIDEIPVLLPRRARNPQLEGPFLEALGERLPVDLAEELAGDFSRTFDALRTVSGKSWEWEDEEYWQAHYLQQSVATVSKGWNDRLFEREFLTSQLFAETDLHGKAILDCGCGEGQNFRQLLADRCDEQSIYIAADISLAGLRLNRRRNRHRRALYVLCSIDDLPIAPESLHVICYFGILHHTQSKARLLRRHVDLLVPGGYILLHEALARPSFLPDSLRGDYQESAHEERIEHAALSAAIRDCAGRLELRSERADSTPFKTGMVRLFGQRVSISRRSYGLLCAMDVALGKLLGPLIPSFGAGAVRMFLRRPESAR